jgi:ABC-2 type transport system permease protein
MPIFDQGYQHWKGELASHAWRWLAVTQHGVRAQLKNRYMRVVLFFSLVPAIGLALVLIIWGLIEQRAEMVMPIIRGLRIGEEMLSDPLAFRSAVWTLAYHFFFQVEMFIAMVLVLLSGPSLISQDLRFNALPLYLSRPMRRFDYFAGKLAVIGFFIAGVVIVPAILAYILGVCFSLDLKIIPATLPILLGSIAYGTIIVLSAGLLMLALSSLSRNSRYVAGFWIGIWFITASVGGAVSGVRFGSAMREAATREFKQSQQRGFQGRKQRPQDIAAIQKMFEERARVEREFFENDWSPMLSYTSNLQRLEQSLLNTNTAWDRLANLALPGPGKTAFVRLKGSQYPWYWSALVLAGLAAISVWILTARVKSLDHLK